MLIKKKMKLFEFLEKATTNASLKIIREEGLSTFVTDDMEEEVDCD